VRVTRILVRSLNFNYIFFPGVVFHELAHAIASVLMGSRVTGGSFWGEREAQVVHEEVPGLRGFLISMAPFFFGTALALLFLQLAQSNIRFSPTPASVFQSLFLYWLAMSAAYHCFPSARDASNARFELGSWYGRALSFSLGAFAGLFAWLTLPLFVALYLLTVPLEILGEIASFGLAWFVVLFFASALWLA
jgi:hypothetical protein